MDGWLIAAVAAWQAFTVGPFSTSKSGHIRAFWAASVPEPTWVADTFAGLELTGYDGTTLAGDVDLWTAEGLDPRKCVPEVVWDSPGHRGARVDHPPKLARGTGHGWHAIWHFETEVENPPAVLSATAFVFCPIDEAHEQPPWGATFTSLDTRIAGPNAKRAYCSKHPQPTERTHFHITGLHTFDAAFACGVLPRVHGRDLVDDCQGDVLLSLDALGAATVAHALPAGTPLDDGELQPYVAGSQVCTRITLDGRFDAKADRAWQAAMNKLGKRLAGAWTREGMIEE
ncbi:MAG: hypothetical protein ACM31C_21610 [Acidobacteriota bacterium]